MMITSKTVSDSKVFGQMFKSFSVQGLDVVAPANVFDSKGYLTEPAYLAWSGSVEDGMKIKQTAEYFGYQVDWNGDRARKIGILPVSEAEPSLR
jgi:hypothetical protein